MMVGAGISVSAGIPDFRTPGTGLYSQLEKYNLPTPESIFNLTYLRSNPRAFFTLAKELFPGEYPATPTHHFIRLLHDKGLLVRCFSQNIDGLELIAGLPEDKLVQAHGGFSRSNCIDCQEPHEAQWVRERIMVDEIPTCKKCEGIVKPAIVFFGESVPPRFTHLAGQDFLQADLLIVLGTSLTVQPFAGLINNVPPTCPRILINREPAGEWTEEDDEQLQRLLAFLATCKQAHGGAMYHMLKKQSSGGFRFIRPDDPPEEAKQKRDLFLQGDCDDGVAQLVKLLGWEEEFAKLLAAAPKPRKAESKEQEAGKSTATVVEKDEKDAADGATDAAATPVSPVPAEWDAGSSAACPTAASEEAS